MKKMVIISMAVIMMLSGCAKKEKAIDWEYGVRYELDGQTVTLYMNKDDNETVECLLSVGAIGEDDTPAMGDQFDFDQVKNDPSSCNGPLEAGGKRSVKISLNMANDDFNAANEKDLIEYLGLEKELTDGRLTLDELRSSSTFRYKDIVNNGDVQKNISFTGEEKYDFKGD